METSNITTKFQATIPLPIRRHIGVKSGDKLAFAIEEDGRVFIKKYEPLDRAYLGHISKELAEEWLSPEDCAAYDHL